MYVWGCTCRRPKPLLFQYSILMTHLMHNHSLSRHAWFKLSMSVKYKLPSVKTWFMKFWITEDINYHVHKADLSQYQWNRQSILEFYTKTMRNIPFKSRRKLITYHFQLWRQPRQLGCLCCRRSGELSLT